MTYDVTIITVRPGTHPDALARLRHRLSATEPTGELLACWYSDLGALNQILLIRCCDDEASLATARAAVLTSKDPFGVGEFTVGMTMDSYVSFPFIPRMTSGHGFTAARGDVQRDRAGDAVHAHLALRYSRRAPTTANEGGGGRSLAAARRP